MAFGFGMRYGTARYGYGFRYDVLAGRGHGSGGATDPLAAHVAAMQGIDGAGGYFLADPAHYAYSLTQAGVFGDAFGGTRTYTAPNTQASPTAVQDPASGLWYVSADGADDTAVGNAAETVAAWTGLFRSPLAAFNNFCALIDEAGYPGDDSTRLGFFSGGSTQFYNAPRSVRRNGTVLLAPYSVAPITSWMVLTIYTATPLTAAIRSLLALDLSYGFNGRLHLAALRTWPTDPSASVVQQTEAEMARFFGPLLATNP